MRAARALADAGLRQNRRPTIISAGVAPSALRHQPAAQSGSTMRAPRVRVDRAILEVLEMTTAPASVLRGDRGAVVCGGPGWGTGGVLLVGRAQARYGKVGWRCCCVGTAGILQSLKQVPLNIAEGRLLGGLDLNATLLNWPTCCRTRALGGSGRWRDHVGDGGAAIGRNDGACHSGDGRWETIVERDGTVPSDACSFRCDRIGRGP